MKHRPVPNHPECKRWLLGITGPREDKAKIIITREVRDGALVYCYRYKPPQERDYILLGRVSRIAKPIQAAEIDLRILDLY